MNAFKKIMKFLAWTICIVLVLVVILVLTIPWWVGPTVKGVTNTFGPSIVKTSVHLGDFGLNPYSRLFHMGDFQLSNPAGFEEPYTAKLGELRVELAPEVISNNVVHVKLIRIKDVFVSYCFNNAFESNFSVLQEGMAREKSEEDDGVIEKEEKREEESGKASEPIKVIIDRFEIEGIVAKIGKISLPLTPTPLVFEDIGKKSGGQTLSEVYDATIGPLVKATDPTVKALDASAKLAIGGINQGLDIGKQGINAVTDGLGKTVESFKAGDIKGATETVEATRKALKTTGKELEKVGRGLKDIGSDLQDLFK